MPQAGARDNNTQLHIDCCSATRGLLVDKAATK